MTALGVMVMHTKTSAKIKELETAGSNFKIGFDMGERFKREIHRLLDRYPFFLEQLNPYLQTTAGQATYQDFLALHRERSPHYLRELEGIAEGAQKPFQDIFAINLRGVFRQILKQDQDSGCFDVALLNDRAAGIGHNEDADPSFRGNQYLVHASVDEKPEFTAFCYPGFLPGNAFGFNQHGLFFSVDHIQPHVTQVGIGRHFIARSMLEAPSLQEAIDRATVPNQASGFSYTIGSAEERRIVIVESAPVGFRIQEVKSWICHSNHCILFEQIEQTVDPSSRSRLDRARDRFQHQGPERLQNVLNILGDQTDKTYPIYRQGHPPDKLETMATVLADLDSREVRLFLDHPRESGDAAMTFSLGAGSLT
jgi:predicted choloylglycine hydrolase